MKPSKRVILLFETVMIMLLCTGCWNYREIEKTTIVAGVAIDKGTNGYKYHLTYEVLTFPGGNEKSVESALLESDGDSVFDAVRKTVAMAEKSYISAIAMSLLSAKSSPKRASRS